MSVRRENMRFRDFVKIEDRHFAAGWNEDGHTSSFDFDLNNTRIDMEGEGSSPEVIYAILDVFDEVMKLEVGGSMHFMGNRDDKNSHGFILRLS